MRKFIVSFVGVAAIVMLLASCDQNVVAGRFSYGDPPGDQRAGTPFEVDILRVVVKATTKATITVEVEDSVPFEEWGTAIDSISITLIDGERTLDLFVDRNGAALYDGSPSICSVTRSHNAELDRYSFSFARNCLERNTHLSVNNVRTFHIPGDRADRAGNSNSLQIPAVCFPNVPCPF